MRISRPHAFRIALTLAAVMVLPLGVQAPTMAAAPPKPKNQTTAVAYSPDGARVAVGAGDGKVVVYTVTTGKAALTLSGHMGAPVTGAAYNPAGDILATAGRDSTVQLWNASTGERLATLHGQEQAVLSLAFTPDGSRLIAGGEDSRVLVWDVGTATLERVLGGNSDFVTSVAVSPDGLLLATATKDARIVLRDAKTFKQRDTLLGHAGEVDALTFSPDGRWLASGGADRQVKIWDLPTRSERHTLKGHDAAVTGLAFGPDGKRLASGGRDGRVEFWDPVRGVRTSEVSASGEAVAGLAFSPSGDKVVEGRANGVANVRKSSDGSIQQTLTLPDPVAGTGSTTSNPTKETGSPTKSTSAGTATSTDTGEIAAPRQVAPLSAELMATSGGPTAPILLVTSSADRYSGYYAEILTAEGLNSFATLDVASLDAAALAQHDVVLLGARSLTGAQVTALTEWVTAGGNLIAMRPDPQLADLLGLSGAGATLSEGYLKIDTARSPGNGLVGETIQFHGTADRYTLAGARAVATLYSNAATATTNPAVSLRTVGSSGGAAASFAYDLATSIVLTRQGNPAWAGQERDGFTPKRSDDMFYGAKSGDLQKDWIDLDKVAIPQADEQQRLLVNLILEMNADRKPLPRFWYLPRGLKAAVVMTGDDHGNNGTQPRFEQFLVDSPADCSVEDWECIRGTSYIYPNTPLTATKAADFASKGFEIGLHVTTRCSDYTQESLLNDYTAQLAEFAQRFPGVPAPRTNRTHCIAWSDWATQAEVELSKSIRLDTNYYYWPPSWVEDRAGFFTGSGIPMRFTDAAGSTVDVYQAATQMTDESGQSYPSVIDTLLDRALGSEGYYGAFTINAHTDVADITESSSVVASAKARGVPVITAKQMLDWLDARNTSTFQGVTGDNSRLAFTVAPGAGARNLDMLIPARSQVGALSGVTRDGSPVTFETRSVKGTEYALVRATAGTYEATYAPDTAAPTVASVSPTDGATDVNRSASVTARFSKAMAPASVTSDTFQLLGAGDLPVQSTVSYDPFTNTAQLTPLTSLDPTASYRAVLYAGTGGGSGTTSGGSPTGVTDTAGNPLASQVAWAFTTRGADNCPCSLWPATATPAVQSAVDPNAVELGVKFRSDVDGFITGVRFFKGPQNTGTHTGSLWSASGERLAQATFTGETASGWQQVTFDAPVPIRANTTYVASYHTPTGYYSLNSDFFATTDLVAGPLRAPATGAVGGNGVYAYSSSPTFPSDSWRGSNYWVDVAFTTTTGPDTVAPAVVATSPAAGASTVSATAAVTATFSEDLAPDTVTASTFELRTSAGAAVPGAVTYDAAARTASITPQSPLAEGATYTATLKGGGSGAAVTDLAGNRLAQDVSWSFTTAAAGQCPCSIWPASAEPVNKTDNDPNAVELGVKFRTDVDGYVAGVRFWKGTQNTGTHTGTLWSATGERLATATFANETASGWQEVSFDAAVPVTAGTTYVASYHTMSGYYAGDVDYFATQGVDSPPVHALATGVSGTNGVYRYSASPAFPTDSWRSANYWVDVVFLATLGPDSTAPTVTATSPADGATGVATSSAISATFNEALDPATVSAQTAGLVGPAGSAVAAAVSYDAATKTIVVQPESPLTPSTTYTATIRGGSADPRVKDVAGNALAADSVWSFSTAAPGACDSPANEIVAENCKPGSPASEWDISGAGDASIQGFATDISVDQGQTVQFKVDTPSTDYRLDIYRLGYYGGKGARKVATVQPSATLPQNQPACLEIDGTTNDNLIDCGNWGVSASWAVPADAVSGLYIARPVREDVSGDLASHIIFIVRDDDGGSDLLFQTSDTTWQAYNQYGGYSLYAGPSGHAHKVSYNRPLTTRTTEPEDNLFNAEYPMIRWLERNGYDVSYLSGIDAHRLGAEIREHKSFLSVGHDEYWSGEQRANVEAARDAGVHLAFLSGNEVYWKTRWEPSTANGASVDTRTLVSYKEGEAQGSEHYDCQGNFNCDPHPTEWTGLWRENAPGHDGGRPENALTGQISWGDATGAIGVPSSATSLPFWRDAGMSGATTLATGTLGYEFDWEQPAFASNNPAGRITLSDTTLVGKNHKMSLYKAPSGALVFGAGTVQWSWGLDSTHDRGSEPADPRIQQATVNLLADMGAQPATLQGSLVRATKDPDQAPPTTTIASPVDGSRVDADSTVTISGTAVDAADRVVYVEVSTDGGTTWERATGTGSWTYSWATPGSGTATLKARAVDGSGNVNRGSTVAQVTVTVSAPPPAAPTGLTATATAAAITLDWADTSGATGYHVYRSDSASGPFEKLTASPVTASAYTDDTATLGTWHFQVTALNAAGESQPSATVNATRVAPPEAPTGLTATATATGVTLDWADGGADVTGYHVYRAASATGTYARVTGTPVVSSAFDDTTAPAGASYYKVTAVNAAAESGQSDSGTATMAKAILLLNPSFEVDANADTRPDSWTSNARFTRSTAAVRSGTYSGRHLTTANTNFTIGQTKTGLTAGTQYDVAGWVNIPATSDAFTFSVQVQWRNSSNTTIRTDTVATYSAGTNGWVKATRSLTSPTGTTRAVVNMVSSSLNGTVYVDDMTLR